MKFAHFNATPAQAVPSRWRLCVLLPEAREAVIEAPGAGPGRKKGGTSDKIIQWPWEKLWENGTFFLENDGSSVFFWLLA